ncbi:MAG TPA: DUF3043 domain-containing protein [Pseudonocardiaceae bacterium]|nr:DUF3043 domain-containing protein [Pseudonocardiaceae bacterium]
MKFPRLRSAGATESDEVATDEVDAVEEQALTSTSRGAITPKKGRPTPKRRDAQGGHRGPVPPPPRTQREASKRNAVTKEERKAQRDERRRGQASGDPRHMMAKDRGPVRAYIRDEVDSHRHMVGLFMPLVAVVLVITVGLSSRPDLQVYSTPLLLALLIVMVGEGLWISRRVIRKVRVEYPDAPDRSFGLGWYAVQRAMTIRRLRLPKARMKPGDEPVAYRD